jgi:hypothetical protein
VLADACRCLRRVALAAAANVIGFRGPTAASYPIKLPRPSRPVRGLS